MKKRILCFGDSNTWGANPIDNSRHPQDQRWTGILQRELGPDYVVIEEGYNGRTTVFDDYPDRRPSGISYFYPCLDSQSPLDLVILMLGTNDLKARFAVTPQSISAGLQRYVDAMAISPMYGKKPQLLIASPILISPAYHNHPVFAEMFGPRADELSKEFAPHYEAFAKNAGLPFFNAAAYARASDVDGVHMEPEEHEKLGLAFAAKVRELLG